MRPSNLINKAVSRYLSYLHGRLQQAEHEIHSHQGSMVKSFLQKAKKTEAGKEFGFGSIRNYSDFASQIPIRSYDAIRDQILRMMNGETNVLAPGLVTWFAKSSGTTADKSKFIPVTTETLNHTLTRGGWYSLALLYHRNPEMRAFGDKNLVLTGNITKTPHPDIRYGDVSAIMLHHMPWIGRPFFTPGTKISLMPEWEKKIELMATICKDQNVGSLAGVPTWTLVLLRRMLELTGSKNMHELWPNAAIYVHGGVGFGPYEEQFRRLFPGNHFKYHEIYNASEGFFASQDLNDRKEGLLLFPDNGIYYEFIPEENWHKANPEAIPLKDVEIDKPYAMVITTNGGLWRYAIGDTVSFTSTSPYRLCVTGRTKQYINTFGEEVMVDNTDRAIEITSRRMNAAVSDYTVAPIHMTVEGKGGHHWLIEFDHPPSNPELFADELDRNLQDLNGDYEAKRYQSMALDRLRLTVIPKGTFRRWLHKKGKIGSQAKIPRLSNDRYYLEDILKLVSFPMAEEQF